MDPKSRRQTNLCMLAGVLLQLTAPISRIPAIERIYAWVTVTDLQYSTRRTYITVL